MAIEKFEEALKQYIQEETQKMKAVSVAALEGSVTEDTIKAAARLLDHQDTMANGIRVRLENAMIDLTRHLENEGYTLPPASILRPGFGDALEEALQRINLREESSETETQAFEFQPKYTFPQDLLEISDEDKENYGSVINNALLTDRGTGLGSLVLGEGQEMPDAKMKLVNAGISLSRRVTFPDRNKPHPENLLPFEVSDFLPHLTYDNIVLLRNNLGNLSAFSNLPTEVLGRDLKELGLDSRTFNCLKRSQILYVTQILIMDELHIGGIRNFGQGGFHNLLITFAANKIIPEAKS